MKRFKNILYVADSSGVVLKAFHHAVDLAARNQARLTVVLAIEPMPSYVARLAPQELRATRLEKLQASLDSLVAWAADRVEVEAKILEGTPFLEIVREVLRHDRDLLVKSVDRHDGAMDWLFGSADMHLLRKCPCPVWLITTSESTSIRRVMACVDLNDLDLSAEDTAEPLNRMILEMAGSLALNEGTELHVVHVSQAFGETLLRGTRARVDDGTVDAFVDEVHRQHRLWLDGLLSKARQWIGPDAYDAVKVRVQTPTGRADDVIPRLARELGVDLIVMGTVARSGIPGLIIGNTAESVLRQIRCSVLAVKPPDFVTPVTLDA